jgi:hypothetical protein
MSAVWEIIPKITSPLAVLCFVFYVIYLIKRSGDKKKLESLKVSDTKAQRQAVDKILSDYPDIKIDKIKDPVGALTLASKIIDDKLKKHNKTMNTLLSFSGIFALTFLISQLIPGISGNKIGGSEPNSKDNVMTWAEANATIKGKEYAILSIVQHIQIEDFNVPDSPTVQKRLASFRNYYTIKALQDISLDKETFLEQFLSNENVILPWAGSEMQKVQSIKEGKYWVKFVARKNEIRTLVTGANYLYPIPLAASRGTNCFPEMTLVKTDWMTCYPNDFDYVDKLTIMIEGKNVALNLPGNGNSTYRRDNTKITSGAGICRTYPNDNGPCTLIGEWENLSPGTCVALKINWTMPN